MLPLPSSLSSLPNIPQGAPVLPYEKPELGVNYWIQDNILPNADDVVARCLAQKKWELGFPRRPEFWPGMRFRPALLPNELAHVEKWVKSVTGKARIWIQKAPEGAKLDSNVAQLVGEKESGPRPHTDSRHLCRFAAVIYLSPHAPRNAGTSFCRLRYPNGAVGGNYVPAPYHNLLDALQVKKLPLEAWYHDIEIENVFNRIILYKANFVHSATRYFGNSNREKRLTAVFFWMCDD